MAEKEYIKLKRRVVYRGEVYNALEAERIKALENISKPYYDGYCDGLKKAIQILANDIEDIPAADVRPVARGHKVTHNRPIAGYWASGKLDGGWDGMEGRVWVEPIMDNPVDYCSECGKRLDDTFQNFCPNCGAMMEES